MKYTSISKAQRKDLRAGFNRAINVSYEDLCEIFDAPEGPSEDGKVKAQWIIRTPEGVGSIYDYKSDMEPRNQTNWHIGGNNLVASYLEACIRKYQGDLGLQISYQEEYETARGLIEDITHALNDEDNRIINSQKEISWGTIADLKRLNQELTEIADRLNQRGEYANN